MLFVPRTADLIGYVCAGRITVDVCFGLQQQQQPPKQQPKPQQKPQPQQKKRQEL